MTIIILIIIIKIIIIIKTFYYQNFFIYSGVISLGMASDVLTGRVLFNVPHIIVNDGK